jgi:hypothetical protein
MRSKLLQGVNRDINESRDVVDRQQENDSSWRTKGHEAPPNPDNPAFDAEALKDFPGLLKRNYRPAGS